jgi:excisionase family DNA binding protein
MSAGPAKIEVLASPMIDDCRSTGSASTGPLRQPHAIDIREENLLSIGFVAKQFGRSRATICRWIRDGRLPAIHIGRAAFVPADELRSLLARDMMASEERRICPKNSR